MVSGQRSQISNFTSEMSDHPKSEISNLRSEILNLKSEMIWLVSHFLFRREQTGLFFDAARLGEPTELAETIREHFSAARAAFKEPQQPEIRGELGAEESR